MKQDEKNVLNKQIPSEILVKIVYVITSILFAIPSLIYLIQNGSVYKFVYMFSMFFTRKYTTLEYYINVTIYIIMFSILFLLYFYILKNVNKVFKTKKSLFIFIVIIGIAFMIIIPTTSSDVYSYIGNGWVDFNYKENPYYIPVQDIIDEFGKDEMLGKVARCWRAEPVVYGAAWSLICKALTSISFGNITVALYIFKIMSLAVFILCNYLIYKITNKKLFVALFGLNPYILFEFLSNVHNDIFLVLFILLAIYFIKNKNNLVLSILCIAIATAIKYLTVLILPFVLIYGLRNERLKNKIIKTILYFIEFLIIIVFFYMFYIKDLNVLSGIFVQQNKYGRSIFLIIWYLLNGSADALNIIKIISLTIFAISYISIVIKLFFAKETSKITFRKIIGTYQVFLLIFTFVLITNFNPWYVIWLFPTVFWQKAKMIKTTLFLSLGAIYSYAITYATGIDNETVGIKYLITMLMTVIVLNIINSKKQIMKKINSKNLIKRRR